ncbi:anti-virulence regulator CigR family protein [Pseudomonas citronellolis]|uniref:anti-virulence regulator CigR family protein n=1 Tax=Pseudomonas citronellolis TaxID=53408 RepID=UPI0023E44DBF|nr:anti-virulence regulator CigR family protein [Pseudomonas citronellolis]MDF3934330.1 anti-virulence regulator CigR family protein [Pseudomonas citronellolis]
MPRLNTLLSAVLGIALVSAAPALLADPGNGKGKGHEKGQHGNQGQAGGNGWQGGPAIDVGGVRVILGDNRDYWSPGASLPPGIQKNLARGKPLPPGIAKKLDGRLVGRLPHYDGYEWQQAGTDLLLVTIATGVIYEVLHDVLD